MATVHLTRTDVTIEAPRGGRLAELCDEHPRAGVPFSCRDANCGTCRVEVVAGEDLCEPPGRDERRLLATLGDKPRHRLACQLVVRAAPGLLKLRVTL